jgi:hypothetical protein
MRRLDQPIKVELAHENAVYAGLLSFDGEIFEAFGFNERQSTRMPIDLIEEVTLGLKKGMLTDPNLSVHGRGGSLGWSANLHPSEAEVAALQEFVDAMNAALEDRGPP